jgi:hypothetical protein
MEKQYCPIRGCVYESKTFIDLLRHMVESERRLPSEHQDWLAEALGEEFKDYAFNKDRRIAQVFKRYFLDTGNNLPNDASIFNDWFEDYQKRTHFKL